MEKKLVGGLKTHAQKGERSQGTAANNRSINNFDQYINGELLAYFNGSQDSLEFIGSLLLFRSEFSYEVQQVREFWEQIVSPEFCKGHVGFMYYEGPRTRLVGVNDSDSLYELLLNTLVRDHSSTQMHVVVLRGNGEIPIILSIPKEFSVSNPRADGRKLALYDMSVASFNVMWDVCVEAEAYRPLVQEACFLLRRVHKMYNGRDRGFIFIPCFYNTEGVPQRNRYVECIVSSTQHNVLVEDCRSIRNIDAWTIEHDFPSELPGWRMKEDHFMILDHAHFSTHKDLTGIKQSVCLPILSMKHLQFYGDRFMFNGMKTDPLFLTRLLEDSIMVSNLYSLQGHCSVTVMTKLGSDEDYTLSVLSVPCLAGETARVESLISPSYEFLHEFHHFHHLDGEYEEGYRVSLQFDQFSGFEFYDVRSFLRPNLNFIYEQLKEELDETE